MSRAGHLMPLERDMWPRPTTGPLRLPCRQQLIQRGSPCSQQPGIPPDLQKSRNASAATGRRARKLPASLPPPAQNSCRGDVGLKVWLGGHALHSPAWHVSTNQGNQVHICQPTAGLTWANEVMDGSDPKVEHRLTRSKPSAPLPPGGEAPGELPPAWCTMRLSRERTPGSDGGVLHA